MIIAKSLEELVKNLRVLESIDVVEEMGKYVIKVNGQHVCIGGKLQAFDYLVDPFGIEVEIKELYEEKLENQALKRKQILLSDREILLAKLFHINPLDLVKIEHNEMSYEYKDKKGISHVFQVLTPEEKRLVKRRLLLNNLFDTENELQVDELKIMELQWDLVENYFQSNEEEILFGDQLEKIIDTTIGKDAFLDMLVEKYPISKCYEMSPTVELEMDGYYICQIY